MMDQNPSEVVSQQLFFKAHFRGFGALNADDAVVRFHFHRTS
jgi:hypothetical protein